jgi:3-isopropylmalate/(R)-2-methylmalate dehydratase small subunit
MRAIGKAHKYGDNIDTDVIIAARYLNTSDMQALVGHCFEDIDPDFPCKVDNGDILVVGSNFGCGSSREHAPAVLKAAGVSAIIAVSFARIFYRNSINIGLPILECPKAVSAIISGDSLEIDFSTGKIYDLTRNTEFHSEPFPPFIQSIIDAGGLIHSVTCKSDTDKE